MISFSHSLITDSKNHNKTINFQLSYHLQINFQLILQNLSFYYVLYLSATDEGKFALFFSFKFFEYFVKFGEQTLISGHSLCLCFACRGLGVAILL